jgi:starch synthase (maltosyl-transferring)
MPRTALSTIDRSRVVVEEERPRVDDGRFPAKRILGDEVEADLFADGDDYDS